MRVTAARKPGQKLFAVWKWTHFNIDIAIDLYHFSSFYLILFYFTLCIIFYPYFSVQFIYIFLTICHVVVSLQEKRIAKQTPQLHFESRMSFLSLKPQLNILSLAVVFLIRHYKIYISFIRSMAYVNHSPHFDSKSHRNIANFSHSNRFVYIYAK